MRVLQVSHLYPHADDPRNGLVVHKQVKGLQAAGCETKVLCPLPWTPFPINCLSEKWRRYSRARPSEVFDDVAVLRPRYLSFPRGWLTASSGSRMYRGIRRVVEDLYMKFSFELIHAHMGLPDGDAARRLSVDFEVPFVVTFRSTDLDRIAMRSARNAYVLRDVFTNAEYLIAPSPHLRTALGDRFDLDARVIEHGFDPKDVHVGSSPLLEKYKGRRILLSVSRLEPRKGIDLNLHALRSLLMRYENLLYLVIGDGPHRSYLEGLVKDLRLEGHVEFIGRLPHRQVMEYMSIGEIFTLPSWQETFGLVYIEAMAHGKPIIGCRGQGVDGIVREKGTGMLADPKDVDSLVEVLDSLLGHPDEARAIGERARRLVLENYTWERNAEKTLDVYKKVLNSRCDSDEQTSAGGS